MKRKVVLLIYTVEVRKKLVDVFLKAFEECIDQQDCFDIVYSKKIGYVWIVVDHAGAEALDTPKKMLDRLFNEIINDVVNDAENKTHIPNALTCPSGRKTKRVAGLPRCFQCSLRTRTATCNS